MLAKLRAAQAEESGFTLVELLIVIAILGVLAGVVVFSVAGVQDNSQTSACKTEASTVRAAEEAYYVKNKEYGTAANLTSSPNKLLSSSPTLVSITLTGTPPGALLPLPGQALASARAARRNPEQSDRRARRFDPGGPFSFPSAWSARGLAAGDGHVGVLDVDVGLAAEVEEGADGDRGEDQDGDDDPGSRRRRRRRAEGAGSGWRRIGRSRDRGGAGRSGRGTRSAGGQPDRAGRSAGQCPGHGRAPGKGSRTVVSGPACREAHQGVTVSAPPSTRHGDQAKGTSVP